MGRKRNALGRGLDALIPVRDHDHRELELDAIVPNRSQPRSRFDEDRLRELAGSIALHGVLQPLIVSTPDENGKHRLIVGERRWQAARIAGIDRVPVVERELASEAAMEIALVENLQREDLDPIEEATAFNRLIREYGLTQEEVARKVSRSRSSVTNSLRLLSLPSKVRQALIEGAITEGHARALLGLPQQASREKALEQVLADGLTVRQTERLVASLKNGTRPAQKSQQSTETLALEDQLRRRLQTKVSVVQGRKAGRIVIEFYSQDDLDTLVDRLLNDGS